MLHALNWLVVFTLFALWSLAAWAFDAVAAWAVSQAHVLAPGAGAVQGVRLPDWLARWLPPEATALFTSALSAFAPAIQGLVDLAPALVGGLSVVVWVIWGIGSVILVALGLVMAKLISTLRRGASPPSGPAAGAVAAR